MYREYNQLLSMELYQDAFVFLSIEMKFVLTISAILY